MIIKPTYASGTIGRGIKTGRTFAEVTADCVCTFTPITDSRNGAAFINVWNIKKRFSVCRIQYKTVHHYKDSDVTLVKSCPQKQQSLYNKSCIQTFNAQWVLIFSTQAYPRNLQNLRN